MNKTLGALYDWKIQAFCSPFPRVPCDPSSPIFNDPSSPDQIDPQEVLNFMQLYQFHKYNTEIFYKGSSTNGIRGTKMVVFPRIGREDRQKGFLIIFKTSENAPLNSRRRPLRRPTLFNTIF